MIRINFIVEDFFYFKYIGCTTAAKMLYSQMKNEPEISVSWNSRDTDFDISHFHSFGPFALSGIHKIKSPKILTAHSTPRLNSDNLAFAKIINSQYPKIYRKFDDVITISEPCQREVMEMVPEMAVEKIPNGVDRNLFKPDRKRREIFRKKFGIGDDEKAVLVIAQITPRKGIYDFLKLAREYPETKWIWTGGFPYNVLSKDFFKIKKALKNKSDNIIFTGFLPDVKEAYCGTDVFFMPSYAEGLPMVILEAISSGLPLVARNIPEFTENFEGCGLFFSNNDEAGEIIERINPGDKHAAISRKFSEKYDIESVAKQHIDFYEKLIE